MQPTSLTGRCCAVLTLYGNQLTDAGGTALGRMLITNRTLTKLDLDDAHIGPRGCVELCKGLAKNKTLLELNMQENNLGDEGFRALGDALAVNCSVQQVALGGNRGYTDVGLTFLALGVRRGKRAAPLNLTGIDFTTIADMIGSCLLTPCPHAFACSLSCQIVHARLNAIYLAPSLPPTFLSLTHSLSHTLIHSLTSASSQTGAHTQHDHTHT